MSATPENIYINTPHLLTRRRRVSDALVTGLMWALYSYLWAPFISLVAWLLGFEFAYDVMVRAGGIHVLKSVLLWYGITVASIFVVVATWSMVNRRRFANADKRQAAKITSSAEIADYFAVDSAQLETMRTARIAKLSLDARGGIEHVESLEIRTRSN